MNLPTCLDGCGHGDSAERLPNVAVRPYARPGINDE
jgi:hypothetical protein